ncbi:MAG: HEAT repeat domain-containing protein [Desulfobulbaceae bacterium]|nr:HEAT repeat domain-containing protein [Desulfobulbaceae bacterium]
MKQHERQELLTLIGDFIEMGHVANIAAMFRQDPDLYALTGDLIRDERYMVRVGMAVLFEELAATRPMEIDLATPFLLPLLQDKTAYVRGEAASLLGIIVSPESLAAIVPLLHDSDSQVAEIAADILAEHGQ